MINFESVPGSYVVKARLKFSDGLQPTEFSDVPPGVPRATLYQYEGCNMKVLFKEGVELTSLVVVDSQKFTGTLFPITDDIKDLDKIQEISFEMNGYETASFKDVPIKNGVIYIPEVLMEPVQPSVG